MTKYSMGIRTVLILTVTSIALGLIVPDAHADITRGDIYRLKIDIDRLQDQIPSYDDRIKKAQDDILLYEKQLAETKERERIAKEWDRLNDTTETKNKVTEAQDNTKKAQQKITDEKKRLVDLLDAKNKIINDIKKLQDKLKSDQKILKSSEKKVLNGLVKMIGIDISETCRTMLLHDIASDCPSYEDLINLDTSKPESGSFQLINGIIQRGQPLLKNDHRLYDFETDFNIILNPQPNMAERIKMIYIQPNMDTYLLPVDMAKHDDKRTVNHDMFVEKCRKAYINAEKWESLLPLMIHHLRNSCDTALETVEIIQDDVTELDISQTQYWKDKLWLEESKVKCRGLCFEY